MRLPDGDIREGLFNLLNNTFQYNGNDVICISGVSNYKEPVIRIGAINMSYSGVKGCISANGSVTISIINKYVESAPWAAISDLANQVLEVVTDIENPFPIPNYLIILNDLSSSSNREEQYEDDSIRLAQDLVINFEIQEFE